MTTAAELADLVAGALEGASTSVVARWEGPADQLATPAVVVAPDEPWLEATGRLASCARASWTVALFTGRWDAPASLQLAQAGYLAALPLIVNLDDYVTVAPLGAPYAENVAGTPTLAARFAVTLSI